MTTLTFDTHAVIKSIQDAGADESLAESIVSAIQAGTGHLDDLATKADLKAELENVATKADLENLELRMTIRLGLMMFAVAGLALAAAKFL